MKTQSKQLVIALVAACMAIVITACGGAGVTVVNSGGSNTSGGDGSSGGNNGGNSSGGGSATVEKPAITTPPGNQSTVAGQSATFTVVATGGAPLSYQWKINGKDISTATSNTYTTPATSMADSGALYSVAVSNSAGSVTSNTATLTVTAAAVAPRITRQPAAQLASAGETASFSVEATGTSPGYQWKLNGKNIDGATSSTYTTPATSSADIAAELVYSVVVSNSAGTVTSSDARLTVSAMPVAPAISTQPAAQTVATGQTATFSVTATGTTLRYQWQKNGKDIDGATSSTYTTDAALMGDDAAVFVVVVSNSLGSVTSSNARLTVYVPVAPTIGTQPVAQTITAGQTATFSVTASGTFPGYQWKRAGVNIPGATSSSYTTPEMSIAGNGVAYSVVVSNSAGTVTSSNATLTVNQSATTGYSLVANASGGSYDKTECVKDMGTGLIWEGKTASPATSRLGTSTYTNYDSTTSAQKTGGGIPSQAEIDASTNSIGYANSVNASGLCGFTDWRLPTKDELLGIVDTDQSPTINSTWFPNTLSVSYSTSTSYGDPLKVWNVGFIHGVGGPGFVSRSGSIALRLVRGGQ